MIETVTKKWGSSLGVIIPREEVNNLNLKSGEEIVIRIEKKSNVLKELFGSMNFDKKTEVLLKETRGELEGKWLK